MKGYIWALLGCGLFTACSSNNNSGSSTADTIDRPATWTEASHSNAATPDYARVFPDDSVKVMRIVMTQTAWDSIKADMTAQCGVFGSGSGSISCSSGNGLDMVGQTPLWVPCTIENDGKQWTHVGIRLKGNSSLTQAWANGQTKLPFRLNMDKFEDQYPEIKNQRFWGFKKLSLFNNNGDETNIKEKVAGELFRDAGVVASHSALLQLTFVHGDSTEDLGMYTMAEVPDEPMFSTQFTTSTGNLYKPTSTLASYIATDFIDDGDTANAADVQDFIQILNDSLRVTNPAAWRGKLDAVFNTKSFLRWLAVNTAIMNRDAYGQMAHNYYLYNEGGALTWIAWDLGLSFTATGSGAMGGGMMDSTAGAMGTPPAGMDTMMLAGMGPLDTTGLGARPDSAGAVGGIGGMGSMSNSIWYENVTAANWPLIRYLMDDVVYKAQYAADMKEIIAGPVSATAVQTKVDKYGALAAPYSTGSTFTTALTGLRDFMTSRIDTINVYLSK